MRFNLLLALLVLLFSSSAVAATSVKGSVTINPPAPTRVYMPLPGDVAPNFALNDVDGGRHKLSDYLDAGNVVVLEWLNPECTFTQKYHANADFMSQTAD